MLNFDGISTLIFDFGGVLINLNRQRCVEKFIDFGITNAPQLLDNYHQMGVFDQLENGDISNEQFYTEIRKISGKNITNQQIHDAFISFLEDVPTEKLELLLRLRQKFRVLMLSNTNAIHFPWCEKNIFSYKNYSLFDFFDHCYLSYKMNLSKPNPEIFRILLQKEQLLPQECLFLDDGEKNIQTAEILGFNTYFVHKNEPLSPLFEKIFEKK